MFPELLLLCTNLAAQTPKIVESSCAKASPEVVLVTSKPSDTTDFLKSSDVDYEDEAVSTEISTKTRSSFFISFTNESEAYWIRPSYLNYQLTDSDGNVFYSGVHTILPTGEGDRGMVPTGTRRQRIAYLPQMRSEYREYLTGSYNVEIISVGYDSIRYR